MRIKSRGGGQGGRSKLDSLATVTDTHAFDTANVSVLHGHYGHYLCGGFP